MVFKKVEFFNNLSFSEKSAEMLCIGKRGVTGHFSDYFTSSLNLRRSCTSPVLCWSLGFISIAIAWEKKVLGWHKFCLSIASIGWLSTGLNHTVLDKSALKQYFHWKKMSQCIFCEKMKAFLPELPEIWPKECRDCFELLVPPQAILSYFYLSDVCLFSNICR